MDSVPEFHPWSPSHFTVIFLTIVLPFVLAFVVRRTKSRRLERSICLTLSALLLINYVAYVFVVRNFGVDHWYKLLPLQLCDWAMIVIIGALWSGNRRWLEVAYFWGIGGSLQAIFTPNLQFGFPDFRFFTFFLDHGAIVAGIIYLMLSRKFRPTLGSVWRTLLWSEIYLAVALAVDHVTGVNYGFLLHKPQAASLLSLLSDWRPLYILQMNIVAILFFALLYAPFAIVDFIRRSVRRMALAQ